MSEIEKKKERILQFLDDTNRLVTQGKIRTHVIENSELNISHYEIEKLIDELSEEGEVVEMRTTSKGSAIMSSDRNTEEFVK